MQKEATFFKVLSDPTRLRLAILLAIRGETCVCDLAAALAEPDFKVSRHLGILRSAGLVEARREGTWMYYRLVEARSNLEGSVQNLLRNVLNAHPTVLADLNRLEKAAAERSRETPTARPSPFPLGS
jgi:ArsR family transcriptional regulator